MTDASPCISAVFSSSYKLLKTVTVSTLPLFGQVMLLCGKFSLYLVELRTCAVSRPSDRHALETCSQFICSVRQYYLQRRITAGAKFSTLSICAGSLHLHTIMTSLQYLPYHVDISFT